MNVLAQKYDDVSNAVAVTEDRIHHLVQLKDESSKLIGVALEHKKEVSDEYNKVLLKVKDLIKSADTINLVIAAITDIAEKTNLFSLNASIEAARAGDTGRGFAVVANEIRNLSEQSFKSTSEISQIVESIKEEIKQTTDIIKLISEKLESQSHSVQKVNSSFDSICHTVEDSLEQLDTAVERMNKLKTEQGLIADTISDIAVIAEQSAASTGEAISVSMLQKQSNEILFQLTHKLQSTITEINSHVKKYDINQEKKTVIKVGFAGIFKKNHPFTKNMTVNARKTAEKFGFDNTPDNIKLLKDDYLQLVISQRQDVFATIALLRIYDHEFGREVKEFELFNTYAITKHSIMAQRKRQNPYSDDN